LRITIKDQRSFWNDLYAKNGKMYGNYPSQLAYDVMRFVFSRNRNFTKQDLCKIKALEVGGGYGRNARYIAEWGVNTTLLDISSQSLQIAREEGLERKLKLVEGDIISQKFDQEFDLVYANFVFHIMNQEVRNSALLGSYKATKKGGYFLSSFLSINDKDFDSLTKEEEIETNTFLLREKPQHFFTSEEVNHLLTSTGFTVIILEQREDPEAIMQVCRNTLYWFAIAQRGESDG